MPAIKTCLSTTSTTAVEPSTDLRTWLAQQAATVMRGSADNHCWLLVHCEDGVIWGELRDDGRLHLSSDVFPERELALRWTTLQQARLFGEQAELLLWRGAQGWRATLHHDAAGDSSECIDEQYLLWGDHGHEPQNGFMRVIEGMQGIVHTPPIDTAPTNEPARTARARLVVRHYLSQDESGLVRIRESRLVQLLQPGE